MTSLRRNNTVAMVIWLLGYFEAISENVFAQINRSQYNAPHKSWLAGWKHVAGLVIYRQTNQHKHAHVSAYYVDLRLPARFF